MIVRKVFQYLNRVPLSSTFAQQFVIRLFPKRAGLQYVPGFDLIIGLFKMMHQ